MFDSQPILTEAARAVLDRLPPPGNPRNENIPVPVARLVDSETGTLGAAVPLVETGRVEEVEIESGMKVVDERTEELFELFKDVVGVGVWVLVVEEVEGGGFHVDVGGVHVDVGVLEVDTPWPKFQSP